MENKKIKILVVDDDPDIIEIISYNLKKENYKVFSCYNGSDSIKIAEKEKPDLIILDIMMPGMDGIQVCEKLRSKNNSNWMDIVRKENKAFRNTLKTLRQNLYETSAKYGDPEFIPANAFRDQAEKMLDTMRRGEKKLPSGDMWEPSSPEYQKVLQQLQQYANIKNLSIPQYRALMADVGSLFDKAKNIGLPADEIADLRGALESGLYNKSINFGVSSSKGRKTFQTLLERKAYLFAYYYELYRRKT